MILAYHEIVPKLIPYRYAVTCSAFDGHLGVVTELRSGIGERGSMLRLTFDDGHASNYRYALPALERDSIHATFFVIGSFINTRSNYMTWAQLRELVSLGHQVQSHGWSHVPLTHCSESKLREELLRSKETIEDKLGIPVESLSAPHGRWNRGVLEACVEAGYKRLFSSDPWIRPHERAGLELSGRFVVDRTMDALRLRYLIEQQWSAVLSLRVKHHVKNALKHLLGDRLYHRLWCHLAGWTGPVEMEVGGDA